MEKSKRILFSIVLLIMITEVVTAILNPKVTAYIRLVLTAILCYSLYMESNAARMISGILFGVAVIFIVYSLVSSFSFGLLVFIFPLLCIYIAALYVLFLYKPVVSLYEDQEPF